MLYESKHNDIKSWCGSSLSTASQIGKNIALKNVCTKLHESKNFVHRKESRCLIYLSNCA